MPAAMVFPVSDRRGHAEPHAEDLEQATAAGRGGRVN